jgi:hypothetical protein
MRFSRERNPVRWLVGVVRRIVHHNPARKLVRAAGSAVDKRPRLAQGEMTPAGLAADTMGEGGWLVFRRGHLLAR